jgi:ABC-type multidrug transport system ATPase subunit
MIELHDVIKRYGRRNAVDHVTFDVPEGTSLALWGSNGAGKTTLIRCILGVTGYDGDVLIDGISSRRKGKDSRKRIGYVPQSMPTFDLTVSEMIHLVARLRRTDPRPGLGRLEEFGLGQTLKQPVASLSGGMKQKLALTLSLLGDPPILLLDEPTANLDARSQSELIASLVELKHQGRTIVFTSHRWSEVRALADRVVRLEAGKVVGHGTVQEMEPKLDTVTLRVPMASEALDPAVAHLTQHGFTAGRNGHAVLVTVDAFRKAEPLVLLAQSEYTVSDFIVEEES